MATISPDVQALTEHMIALRRDLHRHPELGFQEVRTAAIVAERLEALGDAFIGSARPDRSPAPSLHNAKFDIDESCLEVGAEFLVQAALRLLRGA